MEQAFLSLKFIRSDFRITLARDMPENILFIRYNRIFKLYIVELFYFIYIFSILFFKNPNKPE